MAATEHDVGRGAGRETLTANVSLVICTDDGHELAVELAEASCWWRLFFRGAT